MGGVPVSDLQLFTSRHRAVYDFQRTGQRPGFVPVRTSLGKPKFMPESEAWPYVKELAPVGLFHLDGPEFERRYRARLDGFGVLHIAAELFKIAENYPDQPLALLCFEDVTEKPCHRSIFARWWSEQTGLTIPERNFAGELPASPWQWSGGEWRRAVPPVGRPQLEPNGGLER